MRKIPAAGLAALLLLPLSARFASGARGDSGAAENGDPRAQRALGTLYANGAGRERDYGKAAFWYLKAARGGDAEAQYALGTLYGNGLGVAENQAQAAAWYRKAAEGGCAAAQYALGTLYANGLGIAANDAAAVAWYRKAAERGFAGAQTNLGWMYANGRGVAQNAATAAFWYRQAAEQGFARGQYDLGTLYENGRGLPRNEDAAAAWYRAAAAQGFAPAQEALERTQENGRRGFERSAAVATGDEADVDRPEYSVPENADNFAVVIGVEKYESLPAAEFAERDAAAVRAHLTALGYPTRNIYFLSGPRATRARLAQSLNSWLPNRVDANSTVFFYYSGHGAPDPKTRQAYLVPADGDAEDLDSTAYPIEQLYAELGGLKARHVIVALDSCFSGAGGRSVSSSGTRPLVTGVASPPVAENVIALTASSPDEISGTLEHQGHGTFTYYLLKGLAGAAKDDSGHVTARSLYDYLSPKVRDAARLHNRDQTPQLLFAASSEAGVRIR